ncbi:hypothetical protein [Tenacibaculum finnmarkense]|uniref:hypothetical protein n=1 Tax=Tenacibaculum finnmarkense TaxID=2781243 RepID=UPI003BB4A605
MDKTNPDYKLARYLMLETEISLKIFGWELVFLLPMIISIIFIPFKICDLSIISFLDVFNCRQYILIISLSIIYLAQIFIFFICKKHRLKYLVAYNIYDTYSFLFNYKKSTLFLTKTNEQEYSERFDLIKKTLLKIAFTIIFIKAGMLLKYYFMQLERDFKKTYIDLFFDLFYHNLFITSFILIFLSFFFGYYGYKLKSKNKIIYGTLEILIGALITLYSPISKIKTDLINSNNLLSLIIIIILFLSSLRLTISGFENLFKGIKDGNKPKWKKNYFR